jgi:hypothetical protein
MQPSGDKTVPGPAEPDCTDPLCLADLDEFRVVAVISGDANPMAMVEDRGGVGHIVRRNTRIGTQGDFFLDEEPDHIYSSELVRMAFGSVGIRFEHTERLGDLAKGNPAVSSEFIGRWAESKPCKRRYLDYDQCWNVIAHHEVITPDAIIADTRVQKIYASPGMDQQMLAESSAPADANPPAAAVGLRP